MIGTTAWIAKTSGNLSALDRARLLASIVALRVKSRLAKAKPKGHAFAGDRSLDLPDSQLVRHALAECQECCSAAIVHHSCRTYSWAAALAHIEALRFDAEELAVAALLHDLELGRTERRHAAGCDCFAGAGAIAADRWLRAQAVDEPRRQIISQAIALHLNPGVAVSVGTTAHLLNIGAMADVVGTRMSLIGRDQQAQTMECYPRAGFKQEMQHHMRAEKAFAPRTRAGFLINIGFERLIEAAPFAD